MKRKIVFILSLTTDAVSINNDVHRCLNRGRLGLLVENSGIANNNDIKPGRDKSSYREVALMMVIDCPAPLRGWLLRSMPIKLW